MDEIELPPTEPVSQAVDTDESTIKEELAVDLSTIPDEESPFRTVGTNTMRRNACSTTLDNVHESVNTYNFESAERVFTKVIKLYLNVDGSSLQPDIRKSLILAMYQHIALYKHFLADEKFNKINTVVRAKFHQFIHQENHLEFIPIYNEIYNDGLYDSYEIPPVVDLPDDFFANCLAEYKKSLEELRIRNDRKKITPKFSVGEIVGAKDKQGNWWLSRILKLWVEGIHVIYYVEFCGWGERFNEFIVNPYLIQKFNPRMHRLFRGAVNSNNVGDDN